MNQLAPRSHANTSLVDPDDLANALLDTAGDLASGGVQFLKFSKGEWLIGRNNSGFPGNTFHAVVNLPGTKRGYQCWKGGTPIDELWAKLGEQLPPKAALADHSPYAGDGEGWQDAVMFDMVILPENGVTAPIAARYTANSAGGRNAVGALLRAYGEALRSGEAHGLLPKVSFETTHYRHAKYGKVFTPVFNIVEYVSPDTVPTASAADTAEPAHEPRNAQTVRPANKAKPQVKRPVAQTEDDEIPF